MIEYRAFPLLGGNILNFKVLGEISEPTNPTENAIWVNTSTNIEHWIINGKEPTTRSDGTELHVGDVWIQTHNSNGLVSFNALKKNYIDIHLNGVYQWNGSEWLTKQAYCYQNGSFVLISEIITVDLTMLMNGSDRCEYITGGWVGDYTGRSCAAAYDQNVCYSWWSSNGQSYWQNIGTANKIDVTNYNTITFYMAALGGGTGTHSVYCGLYNNKSDHYNTGRVAGNTSTTYTADSNGNFTITIDVSTLTGEYYLAMYMSTANKAISVYMVTRT